MSAGLLYGSVTPEFRARRFIYAQTRQRNWKRLPRPEFRPFGQAVSGRLTL
jgi:hypothetical protein